MRKITIWTKSNILGNTMSKSTNGYGTKWLLTINDNDKNYQTISGVKVVECNVSFDECSKKVKNNTAEYEHKKEFGTW